MEEEGQEINEGGVDSVMAEEYETVKRESYDFRDTFDVYRVYPRIDHAQESAERLGKAANCILPIFGIDKSVETRKTIGSKRYAVSSYNKLVQQLIKTDPPTDRNFYETMLEHQPCHLHIDAEVHYRANANIDHARALELEEMLFRVIKHLFFEMGIKDPENDIRIITLEASNEKQFSRHYIVKLDKIAFKSNYHCGAFMRKVEAFILAEYGTNIEHNPFFVWHKDEEAFKFDPTKLNKQNLVDMAIYTQRRQFRTVGSVKAGEKDYEHRVLRPVGTSSTFSSVEADGPRILDAMVQRVEPGSNLISLLEMDGREPTGKEHNLASRKARLGHLLTKDSIIEFIQDSQMLAQNNNNNNNKAKKEGSFSETFHQVVEDETEQKSVLFTSIVSSIERDIYRLFSHAGTIKNLGFERHKKLIVFSSTSRNCNIAMREHRGNHITFVANLEYLNLHQGCLDADCKSQKITNHFPLSKETQDMIQAYWRQEDKQYSKNDSVIQDFIDFVFDKN